MYQMLSSETAKCLKIGKICCKAANGSELTEQYDKLAYV